MTDELPSERAAQDAKVDAAARRLVDVLEEASPAPVCKSLRSLAVRLLPLVDLDDVLDQFEEEIEEEIERKVSRRYGDYVSRHPVVDAAALDEAVVRLCRSEVAESLIWLGRAVPALAALADVTDSIERGQP